MLRTDYAMKEMKRRGESPDQYLKRDAEEFRHLVDSAHEKDEGEETD